MIGGTTQLTALVVACGLVPAPAEADGYVFGNMPMPVLTEGTMVRWYMMSLGTEVDLHTPALAWKYRAA